MHRITTSKTSLAGIPSQCGSSSRSKLGGGGGGGGGSEKTRKNRAGDRQGKRLETRECHFQP